MLLLFDHQRQEGSASRCKLRKTSLGRREGHRQTDVGANSTEGGEPKGLIVVPGGRADLKCASWAQVDELSSSSRPLSMALSMRHHT